MEEDKVAARYVAEISVDGRKIVLRDILGEERVIEGAISHVDLTGGTVVIATDVA
jgi:predicted RNA-binding protein